jgi:hypothetical protein
MPALISHVPVDLDELFQDGSRTAGTFSGKSRRVVEMTVHVAVVLIVRVLRTEKGGAE